MKLITIKSRGDFQRVRGGVKFNAPAFLLDSKARSATDAGDDPRFGFTITKKVGGAVERNRMRRRLKEAVRQLPDDLARSNFDYVVVARRALLERPFTDICADVAAALTHVHRERIGGRPEKKH